MVCLKQAVWMAVAKGLGIGGVSNADVRTHAHVVCLREHRDSSMIHEFFRL